MRNHEAKLGAWVKSSSAGCFRGCCATPLVREKEIKRPGAAHLECMSRRSTTIFLVINDCKLDKSNNLHYINANMAGNVIPNNILVLWHSC
jgi:hypothetical protein